MTFSQTHLPLPITVIGSLMVAVVAWWYWLHLGRPDIPRSRRIIRRVSLGIMFFSLPVLVAGLSLVDPRQSPRAYIAVWSIAILCIVLVLLTAVFDIINNFFVHRRQQVDAFIESVATTAREKRDRELADSSMKPSRSGGDDDER